MADPRIAAVVDAGHEDYGSCAVWSCAGRSRWWARCRAPASRCPELERAEQAFADRYSGGHVVHRRPARLAAAAPGEDHHTDLAKETYKPLEGMIAKVAPAK